MNIERCRARLEPFHEKWNLVPAGNPLVTHASCLQPALQGNWPVMMKTSDRSDELRGFTLLEWWNGEGAVRMLARDGHTILMDRATGAASLSAMSEAGHDDEAISIICQVLERLHNANHADPPSLVPLSIWFEPLFASTSTESFVRRGKQLAARLLASTEPACVLHGDMHHGNIVSMSTGEWLAIDPQALAGPRAFDYANIFRNPNLEIAADPVRFRARLARVATCSGVERTVLLAWIVALCALSHSWGEDVRLSAGTDQIIAERALAQLDSSM